MSQLRAFCAFSVVLTQTIYRYFQTYCLEDDWNRRYQRALKEGLGSIPGGYPGAYAEDISGDEV